MTNAQGRVGVVMPHGVLFRGGAEGKIREGIVKADLFEAVIGLAPNLFFGASIPVAICVLNRDKPAERRGRVLFVDAAQPGYYRSERAHNFLDRKHIAGIVAAYRAFEDVERFAHVADLAEIEGNDFNLNISRYVDTTEPVETLSVAEALAQLREAERRRDEATARMDALLAELGYQPVKYDHRLDHGLTTAWSNQPQKEGMSRWLRGRETPTGRALSRPLNSSQVPEADG